ncbi:MAG: hypothetical protein ABI921_00330 [Panacibacter sp.]
MEKKYFSNCNKEISEDDILNGLKDYEIAYYKDGELFKKEIFSYGKLLKVIYEAKNRDKDSIIKKHIQFYFGVKFSISSVSENGYTQELYFDETGDYMSKQISFYENQYVYVHEYYNKDNDLINGVKYFEEDGDFKLAIEFDSAKKYFYAYSFETGDAIPLSEALQILGKYS